MLKLLIVDLKPVARMESQMTSEVGVDNLILLYC